VSDRGLADHEVRAELDDARLEVAELAELFVGLSHARQYHHGHLGLLEGASVDTYNKFSVTPGMRLKALHAIEQKVAGDVRRGLNRCAYLAHALAVVNGKVRDE